MTHIAVLLVALMFAGPANADPPRLRVTSFNIRYENPNDGDDSWSRRKEMVAHCIRAANPDLLGIQEGLVAQVEYLTGQLKRYRTIGVGRDDGMRIGELSAIFINSERLNVVESGTFWLSETPDKPGSRSWDSSLSRIVTWAKLSFKDHPDRSFYFLNTHWDHRGQQARLESAKLMREWMRKKAGNSPVILTGDFNCPETSAPMRTLIRGVGDDGPWTDTYRQLHSKVEDDEATFHGFRGTRKGSRIDFILHSPHFRTVEASIDRMNRDGRYPSDHFPVHAVLETR
jgi:endonuclease/exonuclease/phosphatase family metal-dependent hydrolase